MVEWPGVWGLGSCSSVIDKSMGELIRDSALQKDADFPVPVQHLQQIEFISSL